MRQPPNDGGPHSDRKRSSDQYRIQVIDRAIRVLDSFTFDKPELSVGEVSVATGLHKATAHRILMALEYNGLVEQNRVTANYRLGLKLFKLGHQAVAGLNLRDVAKSHLRALMEETGETAHLAILYADEVLYLEKVEGPHVLRMPSRVGRHIPTYCTSVGKAMLSCLDEEEVRHIVQTYPIRAYTPNTAKAVEELLVELKRTRKRGYAVDNEEFELGLRCVGAPIRDYTGEMVGAIGVAGPSTRLTREKIPAVGAVVLKVAASVSQALGFEAFGDDRRGTNNELSIGRPK